LERAKSLRLDKERKRKERQLEEKLRLKRSAERERSRLNRPPKPVKENPILRTDNASGFRGVYKTGDRFRAQIGFEGKKHKLGYFDESSGLNKRLLPIWLKSSTRKEIRIRPSHFRPDVLAHPRTIGSETSRSFFFGLFALELIQGARRLATAHGFEP
jgi:hypothetical protein